jgi:3-hydroxyisobutyrate dehydrogenase-like beta-hydroxyacid dehydrogenase
VGEAGATIAATSTTDLTVIGCGLMGSAVARTVAAASYDVTVWNRTPEKATALQSDRIMPVQSLREAVSASPRVLVVVSTYEDALGAFRDIPGWEGKALVNVGTSVPAEVDLFGDWAAAAGARYLDGAILVYPKEIGTPSGRAVFSGPADVWKECQDILATLGPGVAYVSENIKGASVLDVAAAGAFFTPAITAYVEAAAYAKACGIDPNELLATCEPMLEILREDMNGLTEALVSDGYESDQVTVATYATAMRSFLEAMRGAGQHARHVQAAVASLAAAEAAGYQDLGLYSLARVTSADA